MAGMQDSSGPSNWRAEMRKEDRVKICQHIMMKLTAFFQMIPEPALKEKTRAFESQVFTKAESRQDYLTKIAEGLTNVERQVASNHVSRASGPGPQAMGTASSASNPAAKVAGNQGQPGRNMDGQQGQQHVMRPQQQQLLLQQQQQHHQLQQQQQQHHQLQQPHQNHHQQQQKQEQHLHQQQKPEQHHHQQQQQQQLYQQQFQQRMLMGQQQQQPQQPMHQTQTQQLPSGQAPPPSSHLQQPQSQQQLGQQHVSAQSQLPAQVQQQLSQQQHQLLAQGAKGKIKKHAGKEPKKPATSKATSSSSSAAAAAAAAAAVASAQARSSTPVNAVESPMNTGPVGSGGADASALGGSSRFAQQADGFMSPQQGTSTSVMNPIASQAIQGQQPHAGASGTSQLTAAQSENFLSIIQAASMGAGKLTPEQTAQLKALSPAELQHIIDLAQQTRKGQGLMQGRAPPLAHTGPQQSSQAQVARGMPSQQMQSQQQMRLQQHQLRERQLQILQQQAQQQQAPPAPQQSAQGPQRQPGLQYPLSQHPGQQGLPQTQHGQLGQQGQVPSQQQQLGQKLQMQHKAQQAIQSHAPVQGQKPQQGFPPRQANHQAQTQALPLDGRVPQAAGRAHFSAQANLDAAAALGKAKQAQQHAQQKPFQGQTMQGVQQPLHQHTPGQQQSSQLGINQQQMPQQQMPQQQGSSQQLSQQQVPQQNQRSHLLKMAQATGMTLEQLTKFLSVQKSKPERMNLPPREQQAYLIDQIQKVIQCRQSGGASTAPTSSGAGAPSADQAVGPPSQAMPPRPAGPQGAIPQDAVAAIPQASVQTVPASGAQAGPSSTGDDQVWQKLETLQRKYKSSIENLYPVIRRLSKGQAPERQEALMKHLKECYSLLVMPRASPKPANVTMELLNRVESFFVKLVTYYSRYLPKDGSGADVEGRSGAADQGVSQANPAASAEASGVPTRAEGGPSMQPQQAQMMSGADATRPPHQPFAGPAQRQVVAGAGAGSHVQAQPALMRGQGPADNSATAVAGHTDQQRATSVTPRPPPGSAGHSLSHGVLQRTGGISEAGPDSGLSAAAARAPPNVAPGTANVPAPRGNAATGSASMDLQRVHQAQDLAQMQQALHQSALRGPRDAVSGARPNAKTTAGQAGDVELPGGLSAALQSAQRSGNPNDMNMVKQHMAQAALQQQNGTSDAALRATPDGATTSMVSPVPPTGRPEPTLQEKVLSMQQAVKAAVEQSQRLEARVDSEMKRAKAERIQNTLTALKNNHSLTPQESSELSITSQTGGEKRPFSLVDVDNCPGDDNVIKSKTVFECSAEVGLRLAKRPKNEAAELKALRDAVEADCRAAKARHPCLSLEITKEYGLPVVVCQLMIPEIKLPKMYLRVQRGYPRKGGAAFQFDRPPLGWVGPLLAAKVRFRNAMSIAPAASVGVAAYLDAWAREASAAVAEYLKEEDNEEALGGGGAGTGAVMAPVSA